MITRLEKNWQVLQDHFDLGEEYELYRDQYDPTVISASYPGGAPIQLDEWQDIPGLMHLQVMLSDDPQLGRELRLYNAAPWWYRVKFNVDADSAKRHHRLRFDGVDYYCKVYLNGSYLGSHEGYQNGFSFPAPVRAGENVLYVKVWSPLDFNRIGEKDDPRFLMAERRMMKGTYEHGDSLLHRDRNPVGIWRPVYLEAWECARLDSRMRVEAKADGSVTVRAEVECGRACELTAKLRIVHKQTGRTAKVIEEKVQLQPGVQPISLRCDVDDPQLWNTWDRGEPNLYEARLQLGEIDQTETFGFRDVELLRTPERTEYHLNGRRLYVRGASYYTEAYLSLMHKGRVRRDLELLKRGGCNIVRVHVHRDIPEFYDLCDEMGIAVMQDTDFNWVHPKEEAWTRRAVEIFTGELRDMFNHPSILTWVIMNEPVEPKRLEMGRYAEDNYFMYTQPGPQMLAAAKELDPARTYLLGSYCVNDPDSGDSHNYCGSIDHPIDYYPARDKLPKEKLNTEFGFDATPSMASLVREKKVLNRLGKSDSELEAIQYYQYRFLKYSIESYRLCKYAPTAGHIQFMLADCSPMAHYGVIDYWGCVKLGYEAFLESNQPIGLFLRADEDGNVNVWVVNDFDEAFDGAKLCWTVWDEKGEAVESGEQGLDVAADSIAKIGSLKRAWDGGTWSAALCLTDAKGRVLARNRYDDLFHHPHHPAGHPLHFSHTYGIRLF